MLPGMNPRKMQQMMRQLGIQQVEIPATEVIIRTKDKEIIILNPSVSKVNMMGQENFQISGVVEERALVTKSKITEEDISTVMEQAKVNRETALNALKEAECDLAEAIMDLSEKEE